MEGKRQAQGQTALEHAVAALPGWLLLIGGLALVAMAVLTPAWLEYEQLKWQRTIMAAHTEHLTEQAHRYVQLQAALEAEDPVLLERLAFVELGLKPVGREPLWTPGQPGGGPGGVHHFASNRGSLNDGGDGEWLSEPEWVRPATAWPARPLPRVGRELPVYEPPDTRLTRLTTGRSRFGLIAAGMLCLMAACYPGMWMARREAHETPQQQSARPGLEQA